MDLIAEISSASSNTEIKKLAQGVCNNPNRLKLIIDTFLSTDLRTTQKCAHVLSFVSESCPKQLIPFVARLVDVLHREPSVAVKRNIVRILQNQSIPTSEQGRLADICFKFLLGQEPIAVKVFSMTILHNLCKEYPEMSNELRIVIEDLMEHGSAGILSRGKKILASLG